MHIKTGKVTQVPQRLEITIKRFQAADKYKPSRTRVLFTGEAPPTTPEGRYFYFENVDSKDWLWIGLMKALFHNNFGQTRFERSRKEYWLERFRENGYQLIDAVKDPIQETGRHRIAVIKANSSNLLDEIRNICPDQIVLIKGTVHKALYEFLRSVGLPIVNEQALPFPSNGWQAQFHSQFRDLLDSGKLRAQDSGLKKPKAVPPYLILSIGSQSGLRLEADLIVKR